MDNLPVDGRYRTTKCRDEACRDDLGSSSQDVSPSGWVDSPGDDPNPDDGTDAAGEAEDAALKDILTMTVQVVRETIMAATSAAALRAILKHA